MASKCISIAQEANLDAAKRLYKKAQRAYYNDNGREIMTDQEFDALEDSIRRLDPNWSGLNSTGARVSNKKVEVELPEFMPSLHKIYPDAVAKKFKKLKNDLFWMDKLDGTSLQLIYSLGKPKRLITRGDGHLGKDVSFFIPQLIKLGRIPESIKTKDLTVFRVEGVIQTKVFEKKWASDYDNARQFLNGLFNRQDFHKGLADIDLVVLGVYGQSLWMGLDKADAWGFTTVTRGRLDKDDYSADGLSTLLTERRKVSKYEMDGLVLAEMYWIMHYDSAEKPKEIYAFKFNDDQSAAEVKVLEVLWHKTRQKRWQPEIVIPPTKMDGVVVTRATAHNPMWMKERGISAGAIVKVLRSGGVIPKIVGVVKKVEFEGPPGPFVVQGRLFKMLEHDEVTEVRVIHHFLTTLGIEKLAVKTLTKLYEANLLKHSHDYALWPHTAGRATRIAKLRQAGFGPRQAEIIDEQIVNGMSKKIKLKTLMDASGCFESVGQKRLTQLEDAGISMEQLRASRDTALLPQIKAIKGFAGKTAQQIIDGKRAFSEWYKPLRDVLDVDGSIPPKKVKKVRAGAPLIGQFVSWTGYRDAEQEALVEELGGDVITFGARTTVLLYKEGGKASSKIEKAGSKAMTWEQFKKKFKVRT